MTRSRFLAILAAALASMVPNLHTSEDLYAAADSVRDRDGCVTRATDYECGLEDGAVTLLVEVGAVDWNKPPREREYPEPGWATDQSGAGY